MSYGQNREDKNVFQVFSASISNDKLLRECEDQFSYPVIINSLMLLERKKKVFGIFESRRRKIKLCYILFTAKIELERERVSVLKAALT